MSALRELVAEAQSGPWRLDGENPKSVCGEGGLFVVCDMVGKHESSEADAALVALAPEMALLLADAMDALAPLSGRPDQLTEKIDALLACFAELERRAANPAGGAT